MDAGLPPLMAGYAQQKAPNPPKEFSIAILPDVQYYTYEKIGGKKRCFRRKQIE